MTFRVKKTSNFCQISNAALRDTRLGYCARGILAMVMTHSDEWNTSTNWLRDNTNSEGKVAIANAIKELKACGYLVITPHSKGGRLCGYVWNWSDSPQDARNQESCSQDACNEAPSEDHCVEEHNKEEDRAKALPPPPIQQPAAPKQSTDSKQSVETPPLNRRPPPAPCPWHLDRGISLPEPLRTQNCLEAARLWFQHKKEKNQRLTKSGLERVVKKWGVVFNPITFVRGVEHSVEMGWAAVFLAPCDKGAPGKPPVTPIEDDPFHGISKVTLEDLYRVYGDNDEALMAARARLSREGRH